jgi:hypothetical protein
MQDLYTAVYNQSEDGQPWSGLQTDVSETGRKAF